MHFYDADAMICFVVFAIKYVLFAILQVVQMSIGHHSLTLAFTHAVKQKKILGTSGRTFRASAGYRTPSRAASALLMNG